MTGILETWGIWGLFAGSFLAATVVPFSADAMMGAMLLAGAPPVACLVAASLGNWLGGLTSFGLGWLGKTEWLERWFRVKKSTITSYQARIDRWGSWLALLTWLPIVGDVFAIALGFFKASPLKCSLLMLVGKTARFALWLAIFKLSGLQPIWL